MEEFPKNNSFNWDFLIIILWIFIILNLFNVFGFPCRIVAHEFVSVLFNWNKHSSLMLVFFFSSSVKEEILGYFIKYLKISQDKLALLLVIVLPSFFLVMYHLLSFHRSFGCKASQKISVYGTLYFHISEAKWRVTQLIPAGVVFWLTNDWVT